LQQPAEQILIRFIPGDKVEETQMKGTWNSMDTTAIQRAVKAVAGSLVAHTIVSELTGLLTRYSLMLN
jgi:hypothetical protein